RRPEVDLVVVTVKVPDHRKLIVPALEAGKMVLSEWPLGSTLAESEELAALAEARGLRTMIGLQARSASAIRYLQDLVSQGYVGQVLSTSVVAAGINWGGTVNTSRLYQLDAANGA